MAAQQINPLVVKLYEKLAKQNIKVPEFSRMTGIPKDRIYKWRQEGTSPKSEDEATIKAFLEEENGEIIQQSSTPHNWRNLQHPIYSPVATKRHFPTPTARASYTFQ